MAYEYKRNDNFWDIESLNKLFTLAFYYPKNNYMILSYIDDDGIIDPNNTTQIRAIAQKRNPNFNGKIYLENMKQLGSAYPDKNGNMVPGLQTFMRRIGFAKNGFQADGKTGNNQVINGSKDHRDVYTSSQKLEIPSIYYPVKDTDPEYDPEKHGYFFGYNTTQYDLTILAYFVASLSFVLTKQDDPYKILVTKDEADDGDILSANQLRKFNDELFEKEFKSNMPSRLAYDYYDYDPSTPARYQKTDYKTDSWNARKAWLYTGRFIDVARLNEKMYKVGLKRLLGMLGHQILEFEGLSDGELSDGKGLLDKQVVDMQNLTTGKKVTDPMVVSELIAYNLSDVINLRWLFEHRVYQNNFALKLTLLETYPETVYMRDESYKNTNDKAEIAAAFMGTPAVATAELAVSPTKTYQAKIHYRNVDRQRLTPDSTSAKFVEKVIAPYNKMTDNKVVDFTYPAPNVAKQLSKERGYEIKPTDVLDDTKIWFEANVAKPGTAAHDEFMGMYRFYDNIRGRNFNQSDKYVEDYGSSKQQGYNEDRDSDFIKNLIVHDQLDFTAKDNEYVKELMKEYNTNIFYFDKNGKRTTCLVNFSVGGIHGAEINMVNYEKDLDAWRDQTDELTFVKEQTSHDAIEAINGETYVVLRNGEKEKIRTFMKSGSTKAKAEWRTFPEPSLFKKKDGMLKVNDKYSYVSVGASQHEDFTSYYPLLLTRLEVFMNPERGENVDPYYELFEKRYEKKKEANDKSLEEYVREMADLVQDAMKLLLNSATGAADATFDNNIRMNNVIISMRIIGQLFAWRIGQAQTLAGARVPSTNTDGLYTMDLDAETNERILNEVAEDMYIGIEPEPLTRFVTKDSNNRMEVEDGKISSAKGGSLNSWKGPEPTNSLDHPSAVDRALAYYMNDHPDPANTAFDEDLARQCFAKIIQECSNDPVLILRHFQWILSSSSGTHQYIFAQEKNATTGAILANRTLQHYNRIFLMATTTNTIQTPFVAAKRKVNPNTAKKREKDGETAIQHDPIGKQILEENGFDWQKDGETRDEAKVMKVKNMPFDQNIVIYNNDLHQLTNSEIQKFVSQLDVQAYISLLRKTFENSWSNVA